MTVAERYRSHWAFSYFTIWTGQAFSLIGSQLVQFALIWWLTKTTGSATVLATASLAGLVPQVIFGPLIGPLVDRWNRRLIMIVADSAIALATLMLAYLFAIGKAQIWHLYLIMFIRSTAGGFHWTAMTASTSLMVPKEHLSRVQGLNQLLQGGMNIISAPLGALLLDLLPMQGIIMIDVGTAFLAISPLFFIRIPQPVLLQTAPVSSNGLTVWWYDFREGLRYVWAWKGLMLLLGMAMLVNLLLNPAFSLLPLLVTNHFGGQAIQLGWMNSAWGVGTIVGGAILGVWGGFRKRMYTSLVGLVGIGLGTLMIGMTPSSLFLLAVAGIFVSGLMGPIANGPLFAIFQAVVAPEMQGRVFTLIGSMAAAMSPLGLIIAGPVADALGVRTWFFIGGIACALMGLVGYFVPVLVNIEDGREQSASVEACVSPMVS